MSQLIAVGSVRDVAAKARTSLADAFLNVKLIVLADRSGSMALTDASQGRMRSEVEDELVRKLQQEHPGQLLLASFCDKAELHPNGVLPRPQNETYLLPGLQLIREFCIGDVKAVLISDGEPYESEKEILNEVRVHFRGKLDCYFAGPSESEGARLMQRIADASNGKCATDVLNRNLLQLEHSLHLALEAGR